MSVCSVCSTELIIGEALQCITCHLELWKILSQQTGIPLDKLKGVDAHLKTASAFRVVQVVQEIRDE